jgi:Domain of unknown function (DUF397)
MIPDLEGAVWRKSSRSSGQGGNCVEVAFVGDLTAMRDSKNPAAGALLVSEASWQRFLDTAKRGKFA